MQEATQWQTAKDSLEIPENGYLVSILKNENNKETLLDEFELRTYGTQKARIIQENHYEPFGMTLQGLDYVAEDTRKNSFLFGGKELSQEMGLEGYDFVNRGYDPQKGIFNQIDPLADKMRRWTPYHYCFDNPLRYIDPDGMLPGDYYTRDGNHVATDNINDNKAYVVDKATPHSDGTVSVEGKKYIGNHSDLIALAKTAYAESKGTMENSPITDEHKQEMKAVASTIDNNTDARIEYGNKVSNSTSNPDTKKKMEPFINATLEGTAKAISKIWADGNTQAGIFDKNLENKTFGGKMKSAFEAAIYVMEKPQGYTDHSKGAVGWDGYGSLMKVNEKTGTHNVLITDGFNITHGPADLQKLSATPYKRESTTFVNSTLFFKMAAGQRPF